jgi:hypothetical protein
LHRGSKFQRRPLAGMISLVKSWKICSQVTTEFCLSGKSLFPDDFYTEPSLNQVAKKLEEWIHVTQVLHP